MKTYLVGGAVRDKLLGLPVKEKDWVVVNSTPDELLNQGYLPVGKDFPVFIHPDTKEETALARRERKTGKGYRGFDCYVGREVTLEEDLSRRDLTINAIAEDSEGQLIDPFKGQDDLKSKLLRHVSPAFVEDPLRVLRIARFAAKLPDFRVAPETLALLKTMVKQGELAELTAERVWQEFYKALQQSSPIRFFEVLKDCGALDVLFPALAKQDLSAAFTKTEDPLIRFALVGAHLSAQALKNFCEQYVVPNQFRELAMLIVKYQGAYQNVEQASAKALLEFLQQVDAFRRPERFETFLTTMGLYFSNQTALRLRIALNAAQSVSVKNLLDQQVTGSDIGRALFEERVRAIEQQVDSI